MDNVDGRMYTIKDIEREAKPDFKGRANEAIEKIGKAYNIPFSKVKVKNTRQVEVYNFTEKEKNLILILLRSAKYRPKAHGNRKKSEVTVSELYAYQDNLIRQIDRIPNLSEEIKRYPRYHQAKEIQTRLKNIHERIDELEFYFYISPTEISLNLLRKIEKQLKRWVTETLHEYKDITRSNITRRRQQQGIVEEPDEGLVNEEVMKEVSKKLDLLKKGTDPEIHSIEQLVAKMLKVEIYIRTRKKT